MVTSICDDSRRVEAGACFVAVRGCQADGHRHVGEAVGRGAAAVIVERGAVLPDAPDVPDGVPILRVPDTRTALARLAAAFFQLDSQGNGGDGSGAGLRLIGVTGTNGKTTVCYLLRSILRAAGQTPAMLGTVEYDLVSQVCPAPLTTPGALELCRGLAAARRAGARWAAMEVSSHALDQRRTDGLSFAAAVFTNLSGDHLDYHPSMDDYFDAKRRLFEGLDGRAFAVINADDPRAGDLVRSTRARVRTFGLSGDADVTCAIGSLNATGSRFTLHGLQTPISDGTLHPSPSQGEGPGVRVNPAEVRPSSSQGVGPGVRVDPIEVNCRLIGRHNLMNILAAATAADALGVNGAAIRCGIEALHGVPGRLERVTPDDHPFHVYVDYAHTDAALENVLDVLRPLTPNRLICVFGCGGDRDRTKRPRMALAVGLRADLAVLTSDNPRTEDPMRIIEDARAGWEIEPAPSRRLQPARSQHLCLSRRLQPARSPRMIEPDRRAAIGQAIASAQPGDTVLIAGKGHEDYQIIGREKRWFDDRAVARESLKCGMRNAECRVATDD